MKVRLVFEGAGVAILLLLSYLWPLISPYHMNLYHWVHPVSTIAGGLSIDLIFACVLGTALLFLLDRYDPQRISFVWGAMLALMTGFIVLVAFFVSSEYSLIKLPSLRARVGVFFGVAAATIVLWRFSPRLFQQSLKAMRFGLALLGICACWMLPQLLFLAFGSPAGTADAFVRPGLPANAASQGRIVWILMDELSYDQVFDHRQPDVNLLNFDRLREESVSFSDIQPAGFYTDLVIPSLFLGRRVAGTRSSLGRDLYIKEADAAHWERFNPDATLFADAKRLSWSTGIAGWFNPYCHILRGVLDSCYWDVADIFPYRMSDRKPAVGNALALPLGLLLRLTNIHPSDAQAIGEAQQQVYTSVMNAATSLMKNEAIRFVFIHLPVPHPPGIYDRRTRTFSANGTYLDNLVLADGTLGLFMNILDKTSAASSTMLIVSSDHSWRVPMWRNAPGWTKEEERASGGRFDPRPVLLVHFPGETAAETRAEPFPELETHGIIQSMLEGRQHSQADLDNWLGQNSHVVPTEKAASGLPNP